ncbi:hypothetical protein CMQ_2073 [Grosmannia clavigera kw1407]|uniref:3CxxC-type domain-containing protein n=1 Tax=Grosmannia clavigera (strain kw1407 / UAMH 11150) TaxID=655863 RepID=F0XJJ2_GROCL|nr:uncharacterized protein CMQ_2073 [Grosmannia clavigera kw1407]EFX02024.1 hypothetical protein CMQ_2073 [Grosmannia clavigera kw1407]
MAKKKRAGTSGETRTSFTFPDLHDDIASLVLCDSITPWFNAKGNDEDAIKTYCTNVMGRFKCNHRCTGKMWTSKMVAIVIRGYRRNGYNALVFNQRCKGCNGLGTFTLDNDSYIERISYRLKKWAGVIRTVKQEDSIKDGPPHESSLCEGCKRGVCRQRRLHNAYSDF